ncbi:MAG TPA: hypothetical protein ENJ82_17245 [Bacteroidetes bacterium]|nr:hypothetical protein [Bacteroidota bacterium]
MSKFSHFLYQYKVITFNLILTAFLVGFNPLWLKLLPNSVELNYYLGIVFLCGLFFEFAGIWFKSRFLFSFYDTLQRKVPWYIGSTFLPRVLFSGALATLALESMGALEISDFFLIPIIIFAVLKEFWVRNVLLNTDRESQNDRPPVYKNWLGEVLLFLFICIGYVSIWKVYLLEHPRIYYMVLSPINWAFVGLGFLGVLYCLEMPHYWEQNLRSNPKRIKILSILSLLFPTLGLIAQMYLMEFVR